MKQVVSERVRSVIAENGFSSVFLAKKTNLSQPTIARQISGRCSVSIELVYAILHECPDISSDWLLLGKGEKYVSDNLAPMTGNESDAELTESANELLREKVRLMEIALNANVQTIEAQKRTISSLENQIKMMEEKYKALLYESHEDYFEEKKKEVV